MEEAVNLLEIGGAENVLKALKDLSSIAKEIPNAVQKCGATLADIENLIAAIKTMNSP
jgi:hypothetical protein